MPNQKILMLLQELSAFSTTARPTTSRHAPPKSPKHFHKRAGNNPAWDIYGGGLISWDYGKSSSSWPKTPSGSKRDNGNRRLFESIGLWRKREGILGELEKMVGATGFEPATSSSQIERNFLIHSIFEQFLISSILFGAVWLNFDRIHSENLR